MTGKVGKKGAAEKNSIPGSRKSSFSQLAFLTRRSGEARPIGLASPLLPRSQACCLKKLTFSSQQGKQLFCFLIQIRESSSVLTRLQTTIRNDQSLIKVSCKPYITFYSFCVVLCHFMTECAVTNLVTKSVISVFTSNSVELNGEV